MTACHSARQAIRASNCGESNDASGAGAGHGAGGNTIGNKSTRPVVTTSSAAPGVGLGAKRRRVAAGGAQRLGPGAASTSPQAAEVCYGRAVQTDSQGAGNGRCPDRDPGLGL